MHELVAEHGYRRCLGLLSLARRYGKARLGADMLS